MCDSLLFGIFSCYLLSTKSPNCQTGCPRHIDRPVISVCPRQYRTSGATSGIVYVIVGSVNVITSRYIELSVCVCVCVPCVAQSLFDSKSLLICFINFHNELFVLIILMSQLLSYKHYCKY